MKGSRPLTDIEIAQVEHSLTNKRDRALFVLGCKTGFRVSELLSLRLGDVVAPNGVLRDRVSVRRSKMKGSTEGRTVILNRQAQEVLLQHIAEMHEAGHRAIDCPLFRSPRTGKALTRIQAYRILEGAYETAGVYGTLGTHAMRKSFANAIYDRLNGDLIKTQKALGHRNINSTVSYLSFKQGDIDNAIMSI